MDVKCPNCQKPMRLSDSVVGKRAKCPACLHIFVVSQELAPIPNPAAAPAQTSPASPGDPELPGLIISYQRDLEKALRERDEAMEMVDGFFQLFMGRAREARFTHEEQKEYQDIAQKLFQLQKKFPLLSGLQDVLHRCEKAIQSHK